MAITDILLPIAISFALTFSIMPMIIGYFKSKQFGQEIREEGPEWHQSKSGTPTMGGIVFTIASIITTILMALWQHQLTTSLWLCLLVVLGYGAIGFMDDSIKVFAKRNLGLTSGQKALAQLILAILFYVIYRMDGLLNAIQFPWGEWHIGWFFLLFVIFWLVGFSNAVNLTDGLDGLVSGLGTISFATYAIIAWKQQQYDVLLICLAIIGGLVGFFPYNKKPAKIFMGDTGSLALGGLLATVSILLHQEWTLLLIGFIYVVETLSVMIQVTVFRATGKRVFKMSPIHHHFEMCGWSEWKVDIVFWTISLILSAITLCIIF